MYTRKEEKTYIIKPILNVQPNQRVYEEFEDYYKISKKISEHTRRLIFV